MRKKLSKWKRSLQVRNGLLILILAAVLIQINSAVQYFFARNGIAQEVEQLAKTELKVKNMEILQVVKSVETAVNNMSWIIERQIDKPDSLYMIERLLVSQNNMLTGAFIGFVADYYPERGRWFEPYVKRYDDGTLIERQIGSENHDYLNAQWFLDGIAADSGYWSEPYLDNEGAEGMICSYTLPVHDADGKTIALIGVDISLNWLVDMFITKDNNKQSSVLVSRNGYILACPDKTLVMKTTINEITDQMNDTTVDRITNSMLQGDSGHAEVRNDRGEKSYIYYSPVEGGTGWSMAVVFADKEIYRGLHTVAFQLTLLMILGLALMSFIMYRAARGYMRLQTINAEKERIGSELRIASNIQMGMLPKTFPPYPDRDEVSMFGSLVSAKEVGGDLYDFYIRDEQLFFCIGDVSGKGVPASLVMAVTRSLFRMVSAHEYAPDKMIMQMNNAMSEMNESSMFVTLFVGVLNLRSGLLRYCNAGHCPVALMNKTVELLPVDANIPVGLMPDWKYSIQQTFLQPNDTIFLYTDGLTEAENLTHELFGEARMMKVLQTVSRSPQELIANVTDAIHAFVGNAEQSDDITLLAIQFNKYLNDTTKTNDIQTLTLPNNVETVPQLSSFIEDMAEKHGVDPSVIMNINLAIEEVVVNVMNYAYPKDIVGEVNITATYENRMLIFTIRDSGVPFDPTSATSPDIDLSVDERPIGGLGIFLVRQIMDEISYSYENNQNVLTLKKKI